MTRSTRQPTPVQLLPVASPLQPEHRVRQVVAHAGEVLAEAGYPAAVVAGPEKVRHREPLLVLVATGGTEHRVLEVLGRSEEPAVLLAHGTDNSLAAALEVLARLLQDGRRGVVLQLDAGGGPDPRLGRVLAALAARSRMRAATLGWVGGPSSWLVASAPDPEAIEERHGCRIVTIAMDEVLEQVRAVTEPDAERTARELAAAARSATLEAGARLLGAARVYLALQALAARHHLDGLSIRCFDLVESTQATACLALGLLNDDGIVAGCEGDLPALLTMVLMAAISGRPAFMANPQEIDPRDSSLWLAHCTVAPSLCEHWSLDSHFETGEGVALAGSLPPSPVTLARLGGDGLDRLMAADGDVVATGSSEHRCRTQVRVRLAGGVEHLLRRPLGNHLVLAQGHHAQALGCFSELFLCHPS